MSAVIVAELGGRTGTVTASVPPRPSVHVSQTGPPGPAGPPGPPGPAGSVPNTWTPALQGVLAWPYDPALSVGGTVPAAGSVTAIMVSVDTPITEPVLGIVMYAGAAGTSPQAGTCFAALYDATSRARLAQSADQSAAWASAGTKFMPFTAPLAGLPAGLYYLATTGTGQPAWTRANTWGGAGNINMGAGRLRFGTAAGAYNAPPPTLPALTPALSHWAGLYAVVNAVEESPPAAGQSGGL